MERSSDTAAASAPRVEARDVADHTPEARIAEVAPLRDQRAQILQPVFQPPAVDRRTEAHVAFLDRHVEVAEQPRQVRVIRVVEDDEAGVDRLVAAPAGHHGAGMAAQPRLGLVERDFGEIRKAARRQIGPRCRRRSRRCGDEAGARHRKASELLNRFQISTAATADRIRQTGIAARQSSQRRESRSSGVYGQSHVRACRRYQKTAAYRRSRLSASRPPTSTPPRSKPRSRREAALRCPKSSALPCASCWRASPYRMRRRSIATWPSTLPNGGAGASEAFETSGPWAAGGRPRSLPRFAEDELRVIRLYFTGQDWSA